MDDKSIRVLIVEDSETDAELIALELRRGGLDPSCRRVDTARMMAKAIAEEPWDVIICDYNMPRFDVPGALDILHRSAIDIPIIIVSGAIGEAEAVLLMKSGVHDFIAKDNLTRLVPAIERELRESKNRRLRRDAELALKASEERFRDVVEAASDWIWETGPDQRFTYFSGRVLEVMGIEAEELIGLRREEFGNRESDPDGWRRHLRDLEARRLFRDFRYRAELPNGRDLFLKISGKPVFGADGAFLGYRGTGTDVTAEVEAEQRAATAQSRLANAIESISDGFALWDAEDRLALFNDTFRRYFTKIEDRIRIGAGFDELARLVVEHEVVTDLGCPPDVWVDDRLKGHREARGSVELTLDGGRSLLVTERRTDDGGIVSVYTDITRHKRAEEAISASEGYYRNLFESAADAIFIIDPQTRAFVDVNENSAKGLGYSREELLGMKLEDILPPGGDDSNRERINQLLETGRQEFESMHVRKDGSRFPVEVKARIVEYGGRRAVQGLARDITKRKQAEKALRESEGRFRRLVESSPDAILMHRDWKVLYANPAAAGILAADDPQDLVGLSMDEVIHPDFHRTTRKRSKAVQNSQEHAPPIEIRLCRRDGTTVDVESSGSLVVVEGQPALQSVMRDITERKKMEHQLVHAQKMEAVGQLTGGIAHDFNNLLTVILGNLEWITECVGDDKKLAGMAYSAINAAQTGAELSQRLLAFSRKQPLKHRIVSLHQTILRMQPLIDRTLGEAISSEIKVEGGPWATRADPQQVESAILNLALNARDAMPRGGRLTFELANVHADGEFVAGRPGMSPGDYAMLAVVDSGAGMSPDVLEHAFEPFFTTKPVGKGSGFGLSMIYGFVKQSKGYIDIDSRVDQGTTVRIYLPRAEADPRRTPAEETAGDLPGGGEMVLVVEDNPKVRELTLGILSRLGYRTHEAENGPAALVVLGDVPDIDLLVTDIVMPEGMNGFDLAEAARKLCPGLKTMFMSGYSYDEIAGHGELVESIDILVKPFTKRGLAYKVRNVLDS